MAAVISNRGGFYSTFAYVSEARRMGVEILPPDVNKSGIRWKGRGGGMRVVKAGALSRFVGKNVRVAGLLITGKVVHTKHGDPMEFLTFEDETGLIETTFFPEAYRRFCSIPDRNRPFTLYGRVDADFGAVTLIVKRVDGIPSPKNPETVKLRGSPQQSWGGTDDYYSHARLNLSVFAYILNRDNARCRFIKNAGYLSRARGCWPYFH